MKIYVPADGEMCNVHHDLDCCGRKFNRPDPHTKGIAEGRKAEEKEQAEQRYLGHTAQDFRELLELTNCMAQMLKELWAVYVPSRDPSFLVGFTAWKKARGIE